MPTVLSGDNGSPNITQFPEPKRDDDRPLSHSHKATWLLLKRILSILVGFSTR